MRASLALVFAIAALASWPAPAGAQTRGWKGGASLHLESRYGRVEAGEPDARSRHQGTVGVSVRALAGRGAPILYAAGFDYQLGARSGRSFVYDANLYPLGLGLLVTHGTMIGVRGGVGVSGATGEVPVALQIPVELMIELDLHRRVRLVAWARPGWVFGAGRRGDAGTGAGAGPRVCDELSAAVGLRWGRRYYPHDRTRSAGNGYYLAATYQEQVGDRILGAAFGYSLNAGGGGR